MQFSFPPGTEMFQFSGYRSSIFRPRFRQMNGGGFPHSEISGSKPVCSSPKLIAACHVLHRLLVPSHPPLALCYLTTEISSALHLTQPARVDQIHAFGGVTHYYAVVKEQ